MYSNQNYILYRYQGQPNECIINVCGNSQEIIKPKILLSRFPGTLILQVQILIAKTPPLYIVYIHSIQYYKAERSVLHLFYRINLNIIDKAV